MSRFLIQLLDVNDRDFRSYVRRLEHVCMNPGVDIRLGADIMKDVRSKLAEIGGKADADFAEEVYYKLQAELQRHDVLLREKLKINDRSAADLVAKRLAIATTKLSNHERALYLTPAATKRVLKAAPPTKTLRALRLRSLDSVTKRFDPRLLYALACLIETKSWKAQVHAKMKRVSDKDIVWDSVQAVAVPSDWYNRLHEYLAGKGFYHVNRETGVLLVMPVINPERDGSTVLALSLLLQSAHRLAMESLPYKRRSFIKGRQTVLPEIAHGLQPQLDHIHGLHPTWPVVYELFGAGHISEDEHDAELLFGDVYWTSVEEKLARLVPEMSFWVGTHYLALPSRLAKPVSFHIVDVAAALIGKKLFNAHSIRHLESSVWNELQLRYLKEDIMASLLVKQLMSDEELMLY